MDVALLNGSPKRKKSASGVLLEGLKGYLPQGCAVREFGLHTGHTATEDLNAIASCDALVLAFPLYVDGIPGHLIGALEELADALTAAPPIRRTAYAIVNCGFYEGEQTDVALEMAEHWARRSGLRWGQGLGVGAGGMLVGVNVPMGHGPKKDLGAALERMAERIEGASGARTEFVTANFPRFAYKLAAEQGWRSAVKRNGMTVKDLFMQR